MRVDHQYRRLALPLNATFRRCRAEHLRKLEWFGSLTAHRQIIEEAYEGQQQGCGLMLVCDVNSFPVAQLWIRFMGQEDLRVARFWALRVLEPFQGKGIATSLLLLAEGVAAKHGFHRAEVGAERHNRRACRLYTAAGYSQTHELAEPYSYLTPDGDRRHEIASQFIFGKGLPRAPQQVSAAQLEMGLWHKAGTSIELVAQPHPVSEADLNGRSTIIGPRKVPRIDSDEMCSAAAQFRIVRVEG